MFRSVAAALLLPVAAILCSCVSPRETRETGPVRIGFYGDLSSRGAREGNDALKGAQQRIDEVNAAGGIAGRTVQLIAMDMKQSPTDAVKAFTQLAQEDGVCAVIGSAVPNAGLAVSPVADLAKVPLVSLSIDDRITSPDMTPEKLDAPGPVRRFAFLAQPSATQIAVSIAAYASSHFLLKRYATLYDPADGVSALQARAFESAVRKSGGIVALSAAMTEGELAVHLRAIRDAAADAVFICASSEKNAAAARQGRDMGMTAVFLGSQAWYPSLIEQAGKASENAWFCMGVSPEDPGLAEIGARFMASYGEKPRPAVVPGWDAVGLIAAAVRKAGSSSPQKVRDALDTLIRFKALQGQVDMDRDTHRLSFPLVAVMRIASGGYRTVEPRFSLRPERTVLP